MKNKIRLVVFLLLIGVLAITSGLAQTPKNVLVIGIDLGAIVDLAPARVYEFESAWVTEQVYDNLVGFKGEEFKEVVPELAESWEVSEDGLTWTFRLRKDAKFHSGNPVNADAVVFSLRRALERGEAPIWVLSQFVPDPEMIQKVDEYTVAITMNQPISELLMGAILGFQGVCSILDPAVVKEHSTPDDPLAAKWLADHSAGSGPFILKEWVRGDRIVLEAFPDYWGGKPLLDRIILKDIPEPASQKLLLEKGDVDIAWNLLPDQIEDLRDEEGIRIKETSTFYIRYFAMNVSYEPLSHEEVRDAIRYAIDYDGIIEGIMKGAVVRGQTFIPKGMFGHLDEAPYTRDLEKARSLMREAGYEEGFKVELLSAPTLPERDIAAKIKEDLADINIEVEVRTLVAAMLYEIYRAQKHQMVLAMWGADYADPDALAKPFAHCRTTGPEAKVRQLAWRNMYVNEYVTDLVERAVGEKDMAKREQMYKEIQRIILDKGPYVILYYPLTQIAMRDKVKGLLLPPMWYFSDLAQVYKTE